MPISFPFVLIINPFIAFPFSIEMYFFAKEEKEGSTRYKVYKILGTLLAPIWFSFKWYWCSRFQSQIELSPFEPDIPDPPIRFTLGNALSKEITIIIISFFRDTIENSNCIEKKTIFRLLRGLLRNRNSTLRRDNNCDIVYFAIRVFFSLFLSPPFVHK